MSAASYGQVVVTGTAQKEAWAARVLPPVELVRPGLWSIPTPFPDHPLRYVLSYALETRGGLALVDTGWPTEEGWTGLVTGIAQTGHSIEDVSAVLVTHGHADHYGLARRVRERSGAWVGMHELDARISERLDGEGGFRTADAAWTRRRGGSPEAEKADSRVEQERMLDLGFPVPDRLIADGDLPLGRGTSLRSRWTPGHTPGHLCFHDTTRDVLLTGDHILPRITPNISPSPVQHEDVLGEYLDSLRAMRGLTVGEVLPAHEYRFANLPARVRSLLDHHRVRLQEVIAVLVDQPGADTVTVAAGLAWSRDWSQLTGIIRRSAIGEAYAHLVHLERLGTITNTGPVVDSWKLQPDVDAVAVINRAIAGTGAATSL